MIAFVRFERQVEMLSGDMLPLFGSTSAKTGLAPQYSTAWAVATWLIAGTITSSPGPIFDA